jgi:hypothetical protein
MNSLHKGILLAATLAGIGGVWAAFSAADPAPSSPITRAEAGGSAQSEAIAPMSSLRADWSNLPLEPTPASF